MVATVIGLDNTVSNIWSFVYLTQGIVFWEKGATSNSLETSDDKVFAYESNKCDCATVEMNTRRLQPTGYINVYKNVKLNTDESRHNIRINVSRQTTSIIKHN